jgi:hypothetical protein
MMTIANQEKLAHSADVRMHLSVDGQRLSIGRMGPDYVVLDSPIDHPPADAEIIVTVDGNRTRWRVQLVEGLSATQHRTRISHSS